MDVVGRLKLFLESNKIPNSAFADQCGIPRPTVSQILNGRNKRISDELILKIHNGFPALSVMWLLFGEGTPTIGANIETSDAQMPYNNDHKSLYSSTEQEFTETDDGIKSDLDSVAEKFSDHQSVLSSGVVSGAFTATNENNRPEIKLSTDSSKKITNIVVFYNDNSFQAFLPG